MTGGGAPKQLQVPRVVRNVSIRPFRELRIIAKEDCGAIIRLCSQPGTTTTNSFQYQQQHGQYTHQQQQQRQAQWGASADIPAQGTAEIFGAELSPDTDYIIEAQERCAVYSWGGCLLQIEGEVHQEYESGNQAMNSFMNMSVLVDSMRQLADLRREVGPRILVAGAPSAGKSSLCQILGNYAIRKGWNPTYVELDPRGSTDKNNIKQLPATIGATTIRGVSPSVDGPDSICFYFGYFEPEDSPQLYLELCRVLSGAIHARLKNNISSAIRNVDDGESADEFDETSSQNRHSLPLAASGLIINCPQQPSTVLLSELVGIFGVNVILVVDDPSLKTFLADKYNYIEPESVEQYFQSPDCAPSRQHEDSSAYNRRSPSKHTSSNERQLQNGVKPGSSGISVIGLSKPEGVVAVNQDRLRVLRNSAWRKYFMGWQLGKSLEERPVIIKIRASEYHFVCLDATTVSAGALPVGQSFLGDSLRLSAFSGNLKSLTNSILAIPTGRLKSHVAWSNVAFFVLVRHVEEMTRVQGDGTRDTAGGRVSVGATDFVFDLLAPRSISQDGKSGGLPSNLLIVGDKSVKWSPDSG